ncbi:hypothetical protein RJ55_03289 [Drechmeria coniospora]|nr:hypothetical protein RJ55_03289 [Drechmeria coniospora]
MTFGQHTGPQSPTEAASLHPRPQSPPLARIEEPHTSGSCMDEPRCMFVANCDTGSQLRKAISHLFGRNKSCTLKIPKEVWVYYCRKHYQRIRYRNARTYPSNQMELVKVQIVRLQTWSETNKLKGKGPFIRQWTLSLRKREQSRLENGKGAQALNDGHDDHSIGQGGSAVPVWLIQLVGDGYTTNKMLDIAERLHKEIAAGSLSQVPEIEFLPDIVDDEAGGLPKPARNRRQNSANGALKTPKRKAPELPDLTRRASHSVVFPDRREEVDEDGTDLVSPFGKRARIEGTNDTQYHHQPSGGTFARSEQAYMLPAYGGESSVPPRAPNIVPKMRPLEYNQSYVQAGYVQSRMGQYPLPFHTGQSDSAYYNGAQAAYAQNAARFVDGHGSIDSQLTLPSISSRMSNGVGLHHSPLPSQAPGATRQPHQRSASAYTPASRHVLATTRPSSSGNGIQTAPGQLTVKESGGVVYEVETQSGQALAEEQWATQPYNHVQGWTQDYSQAFALQHHTYHQSAECSQSPRLDEVSPRSKSTIKVHPAFNGGDDGA